MVSKFQNTLFWTQHAPIDRIPGEVVGSGTDRDINSEGVAYAHRLGRGLMRLLDEGQLQDWSGEVVSSPLRRATSTSEIVAGYLSCDLVVDERLRAQNFGVLEGMTFSEIEANGQLAPHLHEYLNDVDLYEDRAPGGESIKDATIRLMAARACYMFDYELGNPVIITHGSMLNVVIGKILDLPTRQTMNINKRYRGMILRDNPAGAHGLDVVPAAEPSH